MSTLSTVEQELVFVGNFIDGAWTILCRIFQSNFSSSPGHSAGRPNWDNARNDVDDEGVNVIWIIRKKGMSEGGHSCN